jgi:outer membrane protein, heavy metal efflux system
MTGSVESHVAATPSLRQARCLHGLRPQLFTFPATVLFCLAGAVPASAGMPPQSARALAPTEVRTPAAPGGKAQPDPKGQGKRQEAEPPQSGPGESHLPQLAEVPASLAALLDEVVRVNPQILAARHAWKAATEMPSQVATPPDPQFTFQQFAVGSPRPFAGFSNSDFAYLGLGVSQELPYPGKLRLRGEIAQRDAAAEREHFEAVRRSVVEQLKRAYYKLAYEHQELKIVDRDGKLLDQIARIADARYRVGQGNQQDVLKAQLEQTKLLRDTAMHHQEHASLQAQIRELLNRPASQPDIVPEALTETPLNYGVDELLGKIRRENPELRGEEEMVRRQSLQLELARKDFYPDFNVQYMWQHTAEQFRDYYMLSFGVRLPIYRSRKQRPEVAQATEELNRSRREYEGQVQQSYFEVRDQFLQAETAARILRMYREGLIPQAAGTFKAGLAAYEANRRDFEMLLTSFRDVLQLDEEYWHTLLDHEIAVARLEQLTGVTLNEKPDPMK